MRVLEVRFTTSSAPFSIAALVATFFLKDVPMSQQQPAEETDEAMKAGERQVDVSVIP